MLELGLPARHAAQPCPTAPAPCSLPSVLQSQLQKQKQKQGEITALESLQLVKTLVRVVSGPRLLLAAGCRTRLPAGADSAPLCCPPQSVYHVSYLRGLFPDSSFKGVDMQNLDGAGRRLAAVAHAQPPTAVAQSTCVQPADLPASIPNMQASTSRCWTPRRRATRRSG